MVHIPPIAYKKAIDQPKESPQLRKSAVRWIPASDATIDRCLKRKRPNPLDAEEDDSATPLGAPPRKLRKMGHAQYDDLKQRVQKSSPECKPSVDSELPGTPTPSDAISNGLPTPPTSPNLQTDPYPAVGDIVTNRSVRTTGASSPLANECAPKIGSTAPQTTQKQISSRYRCGHEVHPAYATQYGVSQCPCCLLSIHLGKLQAVQTMILSKGGAQRWREDVLASNDIQREYHQHKTFTMGGSRKRGSHVLLDGHKLDVSNRHAKKRITNFARSLENSSQLELKWQKDLKNTDKSRDHATSRKLIKQFRKHSAATALEQYKKLSLDGMLTRVEEADQSFMRKRGREWEIATDPDYPDDANEEPATQRYLRTTRAQRKFINDANIASIEQADASKVNGDPLPKRKRRCLDAKVSFNPVVRVCAESDIDVLRKQAASAPSQNLASITNQGRGILRTAQSVAKPYPSTNSTSNIYMEPKCPSEVHALRNSEARRRDEFNRKSYHFIPNQWSKPDSARNVNTSGNRISFEDWDRHTRASQYETARWDAASRSTAGEHRGASEHVMRNSMVLKTPDDQ